MTTTHTSNVKRTNPLILTDVTMLAVIWWESCSQPHAVINPFLGTDICTAASATAIAANTLVGQPLMATQYYFPK